MSDDVVERAKKLLEGTTPGPIASRTMSTHTELLTQDGKLIATIVLDDIHGLRNSWFYAAAPELVPDLIAEVERLQAENAHLRKHFKGVCPDCHGEPQSLKPADGHWYCWNCDTYYEDSSADWGALGRDLETGEKVP